MPLSLFRLTPLAALLAALLLSACTSAEVVSARLAEIRGFQNDIETYQAAAAAGDKAARYKVCYASYKIAYLSSPSPNRPAPVTDQAWEFCSRSAKDGNRHSQYLTGYLLTNYQPSYSWRMEGAQRYAEAVYWYKQSMDQGYEPAHEQYVYYKDWYDKKYGAEKSDLFGKVLAGAFVASVGVYAKAGAATTANAVGAFAADASTQGRAQASTNFAQNAGATQKSAKTGPSPTTQGNASSTPAAQKTAAGRPDALTTKTYSCPGTEKMVVDVAPRIKDTEDGYSSTTDSLACGKAHHRASAFANGLSNPGYMGRSGKVTVIENCSFKAGYGDRRYALVTVRYIYTSSTPCDAAANGISR